MRTTVNLEPDAYSFASLYARGKGITLSAAITELIRRAEQVPEPSSGRLKLSEHGYFVITGPGDPITPEMVKELSEDSID